MFFHALPGFPGITRFLIAGMIWIGALASTSHGPPARVPSVCWSPCTAPARTNS